MRVPLMALAATTAALALAGCSGPSPSTPPEPPVAAPAGAGSPTTLGLYRLTGDPAVGAFELIPLRRLQALGDSFDVDITPFADATLRLAGVGLPAPDDLRLRFKFSHPLPDTSRRIDLHVFDVRLHFLNNDVAATFSGEAGLEASLRGPDEFPIAPAAIPMLNATAWSTWADEVVEPVIGDLGPNLYPYLLVHEDPAQTTFNATAPSGWNVVPMANTVYDVEARFRLTAGQNVDLILAMDASYGSSALKTIPEPGPGSRLNPVYFNPEFNLKEPWKATVAVEGTPQLGNAATQAMLTLTAFDHQGNRPATGNFDPLTAPRTSLRYNSEMDKAEVAIPGTLPVAQEVRNFTGDGSPGSPYVATVAIPGNALTAAGTFLGIAAFEDELSDVIGFTNPLPTQGFTAAGTVVDRWDFTTYVPFLLTVLPSTGGAPTWTQVHNMMVNGDPAVPGSDCLQCHEFGQGGLTISPDKNTAHAQLVGVNSFGCAGQTYIVPSCPGASYLYRKLLPTPAPPCGARMPNGGPYWSASAIQMVNDWISAGAQNN
ncbi:MAG TPA: hypothetical protein VEI97_13435 [bacterium]|nr:hypothetical protein [bacterium]